MKKIVFTVLLLTLSLPLFAQSYGVRGGHNISNLDFKETPGIENKHRNSFYIGFFGDFRINNSVSIVPELQFSPEGAKEENLHLDYIQAPILLKLKLNERFRIGAGPQVGLKSHKKDDNIKNFAYSAVAGAEFKLNKMLFVDLRYTYGISNIFDDVLTTEARNTNIQIGIGYQF